MMMEFLDSSKRFIPAGAGNTYAGRVAIDNGAVYPRWRGEHRQGTSKPLTRCGLSPLARGTRPGDIYQNSWRRFIPAGAGNTIRWRRFLQFLPVYPRWRGEHGEANKIMTYMRGLSPLARGTLSNPFQPHELHRFIPAGAGNTVVFRSAHSPAPVYPRWRGEH